MGADRMANKGARGMAVPVLHSNDVSALAPTMGVTSALQAVAGTNMHIVMSTADASGRPYLVHAVVHKDLAGALCSVGRQ